MTSPPLVRIFTTPPPLTSDVWFMETLMIKVFFLKLLPLLLRFLTLNQTWRGIGIVKNLQQPSPIRDFLIPSPNPRDNYWPNPSGGTSVLARELSFGHPILILDTPKFEILLLRFYLTPHFHENDIFNTPCQKSG